MPQSDTYWLFALYRKFNCQFYKNHLNSNNLNKSLTVKELYERPDRREFWVYLPTYLKSLGLHIGLFSFSSKNPLLYYIFCCRPVHSQDLKKQIFTKTTKSKIKWSYSTYLTKHLNSTTCRNKRRAPKGGGRMFVPGTTSFVIVAATQFSTKDLLARSRCTVYWDVSYTSVVL